MKKAFVVSAVLAILVAVASASPAQAQSKFKIFGAAAYVSPLSDDNITFESVTNSIEVANQTGYDFGFEFRFGKRLGLELDYVNATQDIDFGGTTIGSTDLQPLSATLNFHLIAGKVVDFYFGPTYSYVDWGTIDLNNDGTNAAGVPDISTDTENAWGVSVGLDFNIGDRFAIVTGVRYLQLDLTPENGDSISVDPLISRVGIALRF